VGGHELRWPLLGGAILVLAWATWKAYRWRTGTSARIPLLWPGIFLTVGLLFFWIWLQSSPQVRFLLPLFPLAAWAAGLGLTDLWKNAGRWGRAAAVVAGVLLLLVHPPVHRDTPYQARTLLGQVPAEDFIAHYLPHYPACQFLNQNVRPNEKVLLFGENRGFYLDADYLWGDPQVQEVVAYRRLGTPELLGARLRELGVAWVLYRTDLYGPEFLPPEIVKQMDEMLARYGTMAGQFGPVKVYHLH
jgi:hypothetical protein